MIDVEVNKYKTEFVIKNLCDSFGYSIEEAFEIWSTSKTSKLLEDDYYTDMSAMRFYEELLAELNGSDDWLFEPVY